MADVATVEETMSKWGRQFILAENPDADIPEDATIRFDEDNWIDNGFGGCETCGNGGASVEYSVNVIWQPPLPKRRAIVREYKGSFGDLIRDITSWEDEHGSDS